MNHSVFFEEWRRCLQVHYQDVLQRRDRITEASLTPVMYRVGFTEDELRALYIEATMHVDDIGGDFVPTLPVIASNQLAADEVAFQPHPGECICPSCMEQVNVLKHDDEGQPLDADAQQEKRERHDYDAPEEGPDSGFVQRSLF